MAVVVGIGSVVVAADAVVDTFQQNSQNTVCSSLGNSHLQTEHNPLSYIADQTDLLQVEDD